MSKIIEKIKLRGYWRINFRPLEYKEELLTLEECKNLIEKNMVKQRGWNYPHYPYNNKENAKVTPGKNYYNGWIDWDFHKESWYMYQSGQFLHYAALREDWFDESNFGNQPYEPFKEGEKLEIMSTLYQITEIFEFLSRLTRNGVYENGAQVFITLNNTPNRVLCLTDPSRTPLYDRYATSMSYIEFNNQYSSEELLSKPKELALNAISYFFERFGWHKLPLLSFKNDQDKMYK